MDTYKQAVITAAEELIRRTSAAAAAGHPAAQLVQARARVLANRAGAMPEAVRALALTLAVRSDPSSLASAMTVERALARDDDAPSVSPAEVERIATEDACALAEHAFARVARWAAWSAAAEGGVI